MTRVMVFGTFDGIHEGHRDLFRQARVLVSDPHLIVSVARDVNVTRIKSRDSKRTEQERLEALKKEPLVDEVILSDEHGFLGHILAAKPDAIVLGYDQVGEYVDSLQMYLAVGNMPVSIYRAEPYHPDIYKSSKLGEL